MAAVSIGAEIARRAALSAAVVLVISSAVTDGRVMMWMNAQTSPAGGASRPARTSWVPITAAATRGSPSAPMTPSSASLYVTRPVRTMACVWPPTRVTALQDIPGPAAQPCAPRLAPMEEPA